MLITGIHQAECSKEWIKMLDQTHVRVQMNIQISRGNSIFTTNRAHSISEPAPRTNITAALHSLMRSILHNSMNVIL
jgi:hypothetical protein